MADAISQAEAEKEHGNRLFKDKHFHAAIEAYQKSLSLHESPACYSNLAFCHLKIEEHGSAIAAATKAIELDDTFVKAYYRRASGYLALGKLQDARKDFRKVVQMKPADKDARMKLQQVEKEITAHAFLKAIESEGSIPLSETLDIKDIVVPDDYDGPYILDDGEITLEFVHGVMDRFKSQRLVDKKYVFQILLHAKKLLSSEPNCQVISIPENRHINVCGDIHGQYYDLLHIFNLAGEPSVENPFLFNGDFVDRGSFSVECVVLLLAWKCLYPKHFYMSRGNHEGKNLNHVYGFEGEVKSKYTDKMFTLFQEVFNSLPLCSIINNKVFVVHGGLFSKNDVEIADINKVNRFQDIPDEGLMSEMLWSDPMEGPGRAASKRGIGVAFGPDVTKNFLQKNKLDLIIRSHEVKEEGYTIEHDGQLITVFSAPNYCDQIGNKAAFIRLPGDTLKPQITTFSAQPHPDVPPMRYSGLFGNGMGGMGGMMGC
jgi:serine/threonine-protein phosphatase 5